MTRFISRNWKPALAAFLPLVLLKLAIAGPYRPIEPLPPDILDMHCHVAGIGAGGSGCFVSEKLRHSWRFAVYLRCFGVSADEVEKKGDGVIADHITGTLAQSRYVKKAVMLALDGVVTNGALDQTRTEVYVPNEFVAAAAARHPNLLFGASINPHRVDALERLQWAKANGAVLIKWIPSIMDIDPADPTLEPFYRKLVELNLPLLTHSGQERSFSSAADYLCDPERLRLPLKLGVQVIAAHIASTGKYGGERSSDRLARMMGQYSNVYSEISSLTQINKHFFLKEALTRPEFEGRLMYGSDFPLINTALVSPWYYCGRLSLKQLVAISKISNPWDADVMLKHELGTPAGVFSRSAEMLSR